MWQAKNKKVKGPRQLSRIDRRRGQVVNRKTTYAMAAACSVEMKPDNIALGPIRAMRRAREGASADSTPIWKPSEPKFEKPHSAYDAIVKPRFDRASCEAINARSSTYAANSFSTSLVARSSDTRRISERGTPAKRPTLILVRRGEREVSRRERTTYRGRR